MLTGAAKSLQEAEELYTKSLNIRETALGKNHPDVGYSLLGLADVERSRGNGAQVETLLRRALITLKDGLGEKHPDVVDCQARLNAALSVLGRKAETNTI